MPARVGCLALAGALALPLPPAWGQASAAAARAPVTVNFVNADIEAVTRAFAAMINRAIVVDPRVRGTMTVYSEQPQSIAQAYQSYLWALRGMGFAVVEVAGLLKVVPEAEAKVQTGTVSVGEVTPRGDQIVTQIFTLRHENPNNLVAVLRPLITANNTINASPGSDALVITDYADNLRRIAKIIAALDQPDSGAVDVIPLEHVVAADVAAVVQRLADGGPTVAAPGIARTAGATTVLADARTNSLLVRASSPGRLATVHAVVARLDRPMAGAGIPGAPGMWVVHLKNADATRLATVLRAAFAAQGGAGAPGAGTGTGALAGASTAGQAITAAQMSAQQSAQMSAQGGASAQATAPLSAAAQPSTGGFIQADPSTNSLIITAPEPLYRQLRAMIEQLDQRRAQVYIESMIVEVAGGDAADFGFEWLGKLGRSGNYDVNAVQNLSSGAAPNIISVNSSLAQGNLKLGEGLNIGLARVIDGVTSLSAILRLLQSQTQTNIVSTPNLITLDNEEAKIVVGENVPFITGQFTSTGTGTTNPFQTIERKDVGITLRIRPQIGEGGAIRMQIYQEQSAVKSTTAAGTSNAGPSTTKRSIEGTVTVDDGQILVLGGLIEDTYSTTQSKVPLLGDIPLLGAVFRSESRERKRTNLMVFLRPIVMRDAQTQQRLSDDRYEQIRAYQMGNQPRPSLVLPIERAPVLPPSTPASAVPLAPLDPPVAQPSVAPAAGASAPGAAPRPASRPDSP
ncbi:MAG: type II secretion system protein GspD [Rubrivivax sp. SCN 71-131]|nr:MAG: type II secretion system protein GspD [Rubrivivax sp. SCN 71-131]